MPQLSLLRIAKVKTRFAGHWQWLTTLRLRSSYTPISFVRLTHGHRNQLKMFQTVNLQSAQNSLKPFGQLNYREMRELDNPLNRLDYNDSLGSANSLIIAKNANGVNRAQSVYGQNNVKRS